MRINKNKLKNKIIDKGYTVKGFCEIVNIEVSGYYRRLKNEVPFNLNEINKIIDILDLSSAEVKDIFFNRSIEEIQKANVVKHDDRQIIKSEVGEEQENNTTEESTNIDTDINEFKAVSEVEEEQERTNINIKDYSYMELLQADYINNNIILYDTLKELEIIRLKDIQDGTKTIEGIETIKSILINTIQFNNRQAKELSIFTRR